MLLHPLCEPVTDALQMQPQVGIELELRLVKSTVLVCAFVSHLSAYVSHRCDELNVFTRLFGSAVSYLH